MQPKKERVAATNHNPSNDLTVKDLSKGNKNPDQYSVCFAEFVKAPQTMKMVSVKTGIDRANICRYVRTMRKAKLIKVLKIDYCPITRYKATYWTTNPQLFPIDLQGKLF